MDDRFRANQIAAQASERPPAMAPPYVYDYPMPAVGCDAVVLSTIDGREHVLLIRRGRDPFAGMWALPGGFLEPDETTEAGARRELLEETGLVAADMTLLGVLSTPGRDPRGWVLSVAYMTRLDRALPVAADDAEAVDWFPLDDLPPTAFDHAEAIAMAVRALQASGDSTA